MIKSVKSSESLMSLPLNNFRGNEKKEKGYSVDSKDSRLQAAELKYNLACLWAATTQLENAKLKQELANASAQVSYCKACCK